MAVLSLEAKRSMSVVKPKVEQRFWKITGASCHSLAMSRFLLVPSAILHLPGMWAALTQLCLSVHHSHTSLPRWLRVRHRLYMWHCPSAGEYEFSACVNRRFGGPGMLLLVPGNWYGPVPQPRTKLPEQFVLGKQHSSQRWSYQIPVPGLGFPELRGVHESSLPRGAPWVSGLVSHFVQTWPDRESSHTVQFLDCLDS